MQDIIAIPGMYDQSDQKAVSWLISAGYAYLVKGSLFATASGLEWFSDESKKIEIKKNKTRWKTEVLTGAREGKSDAGYLTLVPTEKDNAAIDSGRRVDRAIDYSPDFIDEKNLPAVLARELGITIAACDSYLSEGRIRLCNGYIRGEHVGIFDFRDRKKGYFNDLCRQCRKLKKIKSQP